MMDPALTRRAQELVDAGEPFASATVVRAQRPTSAEVSSASAQSAPSTVARARHLHSRDFTATISASMRSWSPGTTGRRNLQRSTPVR